MIRILTIALVLLTGLAAVQIALQMTDDPAQAPQVAGDGFSGPITVMDGDSIRVGAIETRLHGIDAPEFDQTCEDAAGVVWPCGRQIRAALRDLYQGRTAICTRVTIDRFGRSVAKCRVDGEDLGHIIVANGWAEAFRRYSMDYDLTEKQAQVQGVGIWSGTFQSPAVYRAQNN